MNSANSKFKSPTEVMIVAFVTILWVVYRYAKGSGYVAPEV